MNQNHTTFLPRWLIVGYGNTLRSDDGVGPRVAEVISELNLPNVQTQIYPLLAPEAADPVSRCQEVIFVDAAVGPGRKVELLALEPAASSQVMAHAANPQTILALARDIFGHCPKAQLLTIPVSNMAIGEQFSPLAQSGFDQAVELLKTCCQIP